MLTLELYKKLTEKLPEEMRCEWDNDGIMVLPYKSHETKKALLCLDVTSDTIERAVNDGFDCIISHHPMIFGKLRAVGYGTVEGENAAVCIRNNIAVLSFHTRLDAAPGGINDRLCELFGLKNRRPFGADGENIGRICELDEAVDFDSFLNTVKNTLGSKYVAYVKNTDKVKTVAVTGGSYDEGVAASHAAGADVFVCGELKYHNMLYAYEVGHSLITVGHNFSEYCSVDCLEQMLSETDVETVKYNGKCPIRYMEAE